jgi:hypothetical protein
VCVCVCDIYIIHVYMYNVHIHIHVCIYICVYIGQDQYLRIYIHTPIHRQLCVCVCACVCVCVCMCVCACVRVYSHRTRCVVRTTQVNTLSFHALLLFLPSFFFFSFFGLLPASAYVRHCLLAAEKACVFLFSKKNKKLLTSKNQKLPANLPFFLFKKKS